ncbi:MAG: TlpA disulfide reductase family protein [Tepidisphaeraceae bacterium]
MSCTTKCLSALAVLLLAATPGVTDAQPTTAPTSAPSWYRRSDQAVLKAYRARIDSHHSAVMAATGDPVDWVDAEKRKAISAAVQGDLQAMIEASAPLLEKNLDIELWQGNAGYIWIWTGVFGSDDLKKQLDAMTPDTGFPAIWRKGFRAADAFFHANGDVAVQKKAVDDLVAAIELERRAVSTAQPLLKAMYLSHPSPEVANYIENVYTNKLEFRDIAKMKQEQAAQERAAKLVGNPLVLEGKLRDGTRLTTADLKGKVILVDFWATWCGPCKVELPRVKKAYADFHDKGLEVIGVSFDQTSQALDKFLAANPDMAWPQFFDPEHPFWENEFGKAYGITGIPVMFLIDKKGVCRSITARDNFETLIPQLLAE